MKEIHSKSVAGYAPTVAAGFLLALAFVFNGCGGGDDMPCFTCLDESNNAEYGCRTYDDYYGAYSCFYTTKDECRNYYGGEVVNNCSGYPPPIDPDPPYDYQSSSSNRGGEPNTSSNSVGSDLSSNSVPPTGNSSSSLSGGEHNTSSSVGSDLSSNSVPPVGNSSSSLSGGGEQSSDSSVQLSSSSSVRASSSSSSPPPEIIYGASVSYGGETYQTVVIGTQTWFKRNLNYNAANSRCYGDNTGGDSQGNCSTYGRLYDWATAMNLPQSCNSQLVTNCGAQVDAKHQGICPSGWHIPNDDDWNTLMTAIGGSSTAGKYLKATSDWYNCGPSGSGNSYLCEDSYGFSALPGGLGYSGGNFLDVGSHGRWWSSSTEDNSSGAYYRAMNYGNEYTSWLNVSKNYLYSVRCVQD
jgi:uncharacterized protein (TIGR02145 family)